MLCARLAMVQEPEEAERLCRGWAGALITFDLTGDVEETKCGGQ